MTTTVARIYRFRGSHSLPTFTEPWCFPHMHDYRVEVVMSGGTDTDELDRLWPGDLRDGVDVNEQFEPSTVENIAERLLSYFGAERVTVWEDDARWGCAQ